MSSKHGFRKVYISDKTRTDNKQTYETGFTLIEVLVVVLLIGVILAFVAPSMNGPRVVTADARAQAIAINAANLVAGIFAQTGTYENIQPGQLGCTPPFSCSGPTQWRADGINWITSSSALASPMTPNANSVTNPSDPNDGLGTGVATPDVVALLTDNQAWANGDTSTTVAVSASSPGDGCWLITLHSTGPEVYGYAPGNCSTLTTCWPEKVPPFDSSADGSMCDIQSLSLGKFPGDPNA